MIHCARNDETCMWRGHRHMGANPRSIYMMDRHPQDAPVILNDQTVLIYQRLRRILIIEEGEVERINLPQDETLCRAMLEGLVDYDRPSLPLGSPPRLIVTMPETPEIPHDTEGRDDDPTVRG